jgi:type IV secretory pathway protease TraF
MSRNPAVAVAACLATTAVVWIARPAPYAIDGLSMAPGLMPGDVVVSDAFPAADRLRQPQRFERWIVESPDGTAIKRLVGLPGETVRIGNGDLSIDGAIRLKGPRVLAETAVAVSRPGVAEGHRVHFESSEVLDDADFATEVNRPLLPVRDVGITVIMQAEASVARIRLGIAGTEVTWRLGARRRACFVAGRLDGHLVATGWMLRDSGTGDDPGCLPTPAAESWSHAAPWPEGDATDTDAPAITLDVDPDTAVVKRVMHWRDVLHRPAADGREEWRLHGDEFLLFGDCPTASRDSRHWGPLHREALRHRAARALPRSRPPVPAP